MKIKNILSKFNKKSNTICIVFSDLKNEMIIYSNIIEKSNLEKFDLVNPYFSDDFYSFVLDKFKTFCEKNKIPTNCKINIILPTNVIFTNTITVPITKEKSPIKMLDVMLDNQYRNRSSLVINTKEISKTKNEITYCIYGTKIEYINTFKAMFNSINKTINSFSYYSGLVCNNISKENDRVVLFVDDNSSYVYLMNNGTLLGSVKLSFGYNIFNRVVDESILIKKEGALKAVLKISSNEKEGMLSCYDECLVDCTSSILFSKWINIIQKENGIVWQDVKVVVPKEFDKYFNCDSNFNYEVVDSNLVNIIDYKNISKDIEI